MGLNKRKYLPNSSVRLLISCAIVSMTHLLILLETIQKATDTIIRNGVGKRALDLFSPRSPYSTDTNSIFAKLKQVVWFIILSHLLINMLWNWLDANWKIQMCCKFFWLYNVMGVVAENTIIFYDQDHLMKNNMLF